MSSWFSRLLNLHADTYSELHKGDKKIQDDDIVSNPKRDIGEPVWAFVQCVRDNPKRFKLEKLKRKPHTRYDRASYIFKDKQTSESWEVTIDYRTTALMYGPTIEWLTNNECSYISRSIAEIYQRRIARIAELRSMRYKRSTKSERERLMGVYGNGVNT